MKSLHSKTLSNKGLTFIEVMVTMVILSVGLVAVFKTFYLSLDRTNHIINRIYATNIMDNKLLEVSRTLQIYKALPIDLQNIDSVNVGNKVVDMEQNIDLKEIEGFPDLFEATITLSWKEGQRDVRLSRSSYISSM